MRACDLRAPRVPLRGQVRGAHRRRAAPPAVRTRLRSRDHLGDRERARDLRLRALRPLGLRAGRDAGRDPAGAKPPRRDREGFAHRRGRIVSRLLCALALLAAAAAPASADAPEGGPDTAFERANQAYLHGDFKGAIDAYEQVVAAGVVHEDLHYNLANAYFRADRLGPAILHYERALLLDPSQEDTEANLKLARDTAAARWQDRLQGAEKDPLWMRALAPFTLGGLTLIFLGLYCGLFLLALVVYLVRPGFVRTALGVLLVFVGLGTLFAGSLLGGRWWLANRVEQGIVLPDELAVKEGSGADYQTSFLIHGGLRLRVTVREGEWIRVRLANGLEGWVRDRDVGRL
ncbi:MAG: tetratricopeptide repeat protein [Myxococcales bacterium]|nr:tetratricopeptide repeat protein [Myxococcales bacterium]